MILHSCKIAAVILISLFLTSCSSYNYSYKTPSNNNDGLYSGSIKEVGLDSLKITTLISDIKNDTFINVHSVLISKNNKLVLEEYFNETNVNSKQQLRSAAKSFASALTGIAIDKGLLKSSDQSVLNFFNFYPVIKNWDKRKDRLKLKHLLTMTAGLNCGKIMEKNSNCGPKMSQQKDPLKYVLDLRMTHEPGEYFSYNDGIPLLVLGMIGISAQISVGEFENKYLYTPLGITKDPITYGISARDMMKFGLLYLNKGVWNGKRIISEEWVKESTSIHIKNPSQYHKGYGYYWWIRDYNINNKTYETYFAAGNGGQYIFIIPEEELVVVFTGGNYTDYNFSPSFEVRAQPYNMLGKYILPALIK